LNNKIWSDESYKNDSCPSFIHLPSVDSKQVYRLFVEYKNKDHRDSIGERFMIVCEPHWDCSNDDEYFESYVLWKSEKLSDLESIQNCLSAPC